MQKVRLSVMRFMILILMLMIPSMVFSQFVANNGQIAHREINKLRPDIKFQLTGGSVISNFKTNGIENYYFKVRETSRENWSKELLEDEQMGRKLRIPKDLYFFRFDVIFEGANPDAQINPSDISTSYRNYYYEFCPDGILNVPEYKTIVYKELYKNIDLKYICNESTIKYEFILHKGARISDIRMNYEGVDDLQIDKSGNLSYLVAGEQMIEQAPYTFYTANNQELQSQYKIVNGSEISFDIPGQEIIDQDLTIDPVLRWSTYFQGAYGGYQYDPGVDDDGNIYICTEEGAGTLPVLNAGSGQWYQATTTGGILNWDLAIFKFGSDYSLAWCTFYGGHSCEQGWGKRNIAVDNVNNRVYCSGTTGIVYGGNVQDFPVYTPGGGAFYQDNSMYPGSDVPFILAFSTTGVRQWATLFTYETAPFSGAMGTHIESMYFRNSYLYFAGETNKYSHSGIPLRTLSGAYNNSYYCGGVVPFVGRFNTSFGLEWCSYINNNIATSSFSTGCIDMVVDASNNIFMVNDYSEYSGSGISNLLPLVNPGGAYYQTSAAAFGTSRRGNHITKLNPANSSILWGTFFQGTNYGAGTWPDFASCLEVNNAGDLFVGFRGVYSADFPVTFLAGAYNQAARTSTSGSDAGIARFTNGGVKLWASYLNGATQPTTSTGLYDIDAYPDNSIVATGNTATSDFPVVNLAGSYYKGTITTAGTTEGYFTKFSTGCGMLWSTYFPIGYGYGAITSTPCAIRYVVDNSGGANVPLLNPGAPAYYSSTTQNYQSFQVFEDVSFTPSVAATSITATPTSVCSGSPTTLSINGGSLGTGASWQWYTSSCGGASAGTGSSIIVNPAVNTTYYARAVGTCDVTSCVSVLVTINPPAPATPGAISGLTPVCPGTSQSYTISAVPDATTYTWNVPAGWNITAGAGSTSITVTAGSAGQNGNITVTAGNTCGTSAASSLPVVVSPATPATPGAISGLTPVCPGTSQTYTISAVPNASTYTWNIPAGWSITGGAGSTSITVTAGSAGQNGNITVTAGNTCGTSAASILAVVVSPATPATPGAISGLTPVCPGTSQSYTISAVPNATTYTWNVPAGWSITGGAGTTTITVTAGSAGQNGNITVTAGNTCGTSAASSLPVVVSPATPATPGAISGLTPVCPGTSQSYTISAVPDATTYTWNVPAGWNITAGAGSTSITVTAGSAGQNGNITVTAGNTCGTSAASILAVVVSSATPATPGAISGLTPVCPGTSQSYTISAIPNATTYTWNVPAGWSITGGAGSTSITVTAGSAGQNGNITVTAGNTCGTSAASILAVVVSPATPATPGAISGLTPVCPGTSQTYTISAVPNASTYTWNVPAGWNITGGAGSTSITVTAGSAGQNGNITVTAGNTCGTSAASILAVVVSPATPATPGAITGSPTVCPGSSGLIYSISGVADATTYTWMVPAGWSINAGAGTTTISVTAGTAGQNGTITVTAGNTCGTSASSTLNVSVTATVAASLGISASANPVCEGTLVTFTAAPVNGGATPTYQWYLNGSPTGAGGDTYSSNTLTNSNQVYCIMTSSELCATGSPSTSNTVIMAINALSVAPTSVTTSVNPICNGSSSLLTVQGGSLGTAADWIWYSGSCGGTSLGTGNSITVSPSGDSTYYVLAQGTCNTTLCTSVTLNVTDVSAIASGDQTICTSDTATLSVSGTGSFTWSYLGLTTPSITVTPGATTTYTVTAVNGTCNATDVVTVYVTSQADATITSAGPYCTGLTPLTLTALYPGGTWTGDGITNGTTGLFNPALAGIGTHDIIYTISGSCGDSDTITLTVNASVDATITPVGPYCSNAPDVILPAATAGGTWSGQGITNTITGQFSPGMVGAGSYEIVYTISGSCGNSDTLTIVVNAAHNANINPAGPFCETGNFSYLTSVETGGTWSGTGITSALSGSFDPAVAGPGTHDIIYTISGTCGDSDTIQIVVNALANTEILSTGPFCNNLPAFNLSAATPGGIWSGAGITNTASGAFNPGLAGVGMHTIIYIVTGACGNSDTVSVVVNPSPAATSTAINETCMGASNGTATCTASGGTVPYSYLWENAATSSTISALAPGQYTVIITDVNGCADADTAYVSAATIACETIIPAVYIPNAFSPNGDGNNDVLFVRGQGISVLDVKIYDRWGEKVFETSELSNGWDGTFKGKMMDQGVFVYYMYVQFTDGTVKDDKGNISLLK